jgi:hypothetical protein
LRASRGRVILILLCGERLEGGGKEENRVVYDPYSTCKIAREEALYLSQL